MIDFENRIYNDLKEILVNSSVGNVSMSTDSENIPSSFPHISFVEADNSTYEKTIDSGSNENHAKVMYEINVWSKRNKKEAKNITNQVDNFMINLGFSRISKVPISTSSLYRIVIRYEAVISKNFEIYRR